MSIVTLTSSFTADVAVVLVVYNSIALIQP
jgi:hypothetical protein